MMDKKDLKNNLVGNALDFLKRAIEEFEQYPKYSVIHFYTALELFLKARLLDEHWSLVVSKNPDWGKFIAGDFASVTFEEACVRLDKIVQSPLPEGAKNKFNKIREHRNKMVHFFHNAKTSPKEMDKIAVEQLSAWHDLHKIMTVNWGKVFAPWKLEFNKIERKLKKYREYLAAKFSSMEQMISDLKAKGTRFKDCPACGFASAKVFEIVEGLEETVCLLCDHSEKYLIIKCPDCQKETFLTDGSNFICSKCGYKCDESQLVDEINESPSTKDNYFENPYPANCGNCDGYHTVVAYKGGSLCVMCLDYTSDDLEYCSWCNEANTGDMSESEYKGCGQCDGNPHWKDD